MSYSEDDLNMDVHASHEEELKMQTAANGTAKDDGAEEAEEGEEEGEGDVIEQGKDISDDSSEEEEEDEETARKIREGFIVDEDEEEEEEDDEEERRRRKKRRKHKHRHKHRKRDGDEDEDLDEEDLELLEENTGGRIRSRHLTRLRRGRDSDDSGEGAPSRRKAIVESSDDDLDEANIIGAQDIQDIQDIWNDERAVRDDDDEMDMDDFIDDEEDEEEGAGAMAEEEREERRRERRRLEKERRRALRNRPELTGIDASTWDEIHDVFGDGHDYDWALVDEEEETMAHETIKQEMKYQDVFEPSEIKARFLTEDDDLIRAQDIPEGMQLVNSTLSPNVTVAFPELFTAADCVDAASWVTPRLGGVKERDFFKANGEFHYLLDKLVAAVTRALEFLFVQHLEVPYIYAHRRDFISYFNPQDERATRVQLLNQNDLWRIYILGQKYRSLYQRKRSLQRIYESLEARDEYYEQQLRPNMDTIEVVADVTQWLGLKYKDLQKKSSIKLQSRDEEDQTEGRKHKLPSRMSAYEVAKSSIVSKIAEGYGIKSHEIVVNFMSAGHNVHFVEDQELSPIAFAEQYADPDPSKALPVEALLRQARMIIATELGIDPLIRRHVRDQFKNFAQVSILPTERGKIKIHDHSRYYTFKYLHNKPITEMLHSPQFLNILQAEYEQLVTVTIALPNEHKQKLINQLVEAFASDSFSEMAKVWNEERALVVEEAVDKHLIPMGVKWVREYLREEVEDFLAKSCADALNEKINVAPYKPPKLQEGEQPSVLAVSWGKGDPKKDEINLVFLDEAGRFREHAQIDTLQDRKFRAEFRDFVKRRRPDVVVVGGLSFNTSTLSHHVKMTLHPHKSEVLRGDETGFLDDEMSDDPAFDIPVIYVHDEVARLYRHGKRAAEEFPHLPQVARYCVGLARYVQSPLNEYAALGGDIVAVTFDGVVQPLVPQEKLLSAFECVLVDNVNRVGVDINRAVNDPYYASLLPFVAGLGPRKAQALIKKIVSLGGNLVNREQFVKSGILTMRIFLNAAGFLRIAQDPDYKEPKNRGGSSVDYSNSPDPLDDTRIHPEDYDLARKMATDALELDEEDVHDEHPSAVVAQIMKDPDNVRKLDELNLDDFAISMEQSNGELKRHTLNVIRSELIRPFGEGRPKFALPEPSEVLTMLTGDNARTLGIGMIISVYVLRVTDHYAVVRLPSGLEGIINAMYLSDDGSKIVKKGQTLPGVVIDVKIDLVKDSFNAELSSRPSDIAAGDAQFRRFKPDEYWNVAQAERDLDVQQRKKRAGGDRTRRIIKHPNFQNLDSAQAEAYLEKQHPGDVVIRPSSKGFNHLAVTWKVADKLYQHIDVVETNPDRSGQALGGQLIVDGKYEFTDLDELIVNHVKAMSRRVEELMAHEKFKKDDDELQKFLMSFVAANPNKSIYGFSLNRKKPGHFNLSFLPKKGSSIQTWPVRVAPEAYYLFDAAAAGVSELCNAFKVRYLHESQNAGTAAAGGKTPYGAGRMTPARPSGLATPGHASVRQVAQTPNPYSAPMPPPSMVTPIPGSSYGGSSSYGAPSGFGFQTPRHGGVPGQQPASGINPARPAVMSNMGPSGSSGGWTNGGWS